MDGAGRVTLEWAAPADTGGTGLVDYIIKRSSDGGSQWNTVADAVSTETSLVITGLTNGVQYRFKVAAKNHVSVGTWSDVVSATPATAPGKPLRVSARRGPGRVTLSWRRPASSGGASITDYRILMSLDGIEWKIGRAHV